jgi:mannose-6-phosphate isomerase
MDRVWGGRRLETLYGKNLPTDVPIGESWEVVDREDAQSVVKDGPFAGKTLHGLWTNHRSEIFGSDLPDSPRFPLLFKLLDAEDKLSVQVHPPAEVAPELKGEPKTEMWFIAHCRPESDLYVGMNRGVTREDFEKALKEGTVADKVQRLPVKPGDAIFIPSGRIHAIGAGNVIVEVQQNSDTTYRVFDWNRVGLDGAPRALHIEESMKSIDFSDVEPSLASPSDETLAQCEYFRVEKWDLPSDRKATDPGQFAIFTCVTGKVECGGLQYHPGDFFLVPATMEKPVLHPLEAGSCVVRSTIPAGKK